MVHTNGVHHIALITCECHGCNELPIDLATCRLLPASFQHIRTLFSMQLLDHFRLANLEMKASAYQFYQLLRRITLPMAPSQVVDLYNEFRRMSRLWRWMKKLKWSGFGHNNRRVDDVQDGELAIYCPSCPQPNINIPADWKDDPNRYPGYFSVADECSLSRQMGFSPDVCGRRQFQSGSCPARLSRCGHLVIGGWRHGSEKR